MLDSFEILTTTGIVLWSKQYSPVGANVINSLIKEVFIEESAGPGAAPAVINDVSAVRNPPFKKERYTLKWTTAKDLGLIFVAVYQSLLHLSWIDKLLDNVKTLFTTLYGEQFKKNYTSIIKCPFDDYFDRQVQELEKSSSEPVVTAASLTSAQQATLTPPSSAEDDVAIDEPPPPPIPTFRKTPARPIIEGETTSTEITPIQTPDSSRPASPAAHLITGKSGPAGRTSRRARKAATASAPTARGDSTLNNGNTGKASGKKSRRWDDGGLGDEYDDDDAVLDYSAQAKEDGASTALSNPAVQPAIAQDSWSKRTGKGEVVLKDLDDEIDAILSSAASKQHQEQQADAASSASAAGLVNSGLGAITGLFRNVIGGKTLNKDDIAKALQGMEAHLIKKNVAQEAAVRLCDAVSADLTGAKTASFQSIDAKIREAMEKALTHILTPTSSLDLLRSIQATLDRNRKPGGSHRPYVISVVGVNGVGKSTTLAKLAFLLLHNNYRVLVVGGDTFRSGAVEQLRVHVRNLQQLIDTQSGVSGTALGKIDLFERGYGKDPAHIARDAVAMASSTDPASAFDVVLIDTAGRRHNDTRLMSSLENFGRLAQPDKIFMVGEALVGSDAVAQARHFNASFGPGRGLDGFIVSKCDTVGEMVGTIVSMVHATGVPVVAVGVGQHYGDLRTLNVGWATRLLMQ